MLMMHPIELHCQQGGVFYHPHALLNNKIKQEWGNKSQEYECRGVTNT